MNLLYSESIVLIPTISFYVLKFTYMWYVLKEINKPFIYLFILELLSPSYKYLPLLDEPVSFR